MASRPTESGPMRLARAFHMEHLAWSLRRLHCPVARDALVLEVGSGGNPYARSNVLLDAYPETHERHWVPLTLDRPFVFGFLEKLPFKDKSFDFVIASHVLEHSAAPDQALEEMQRVARAGYIEVPDAFMERVNPYQDHRAEITVRGGRLIIRKKGDWVMDRELVELYEDRAKPFVAGELIPARPFAFHVRHYWDDRIDFEVLNPETNSAWTSPTAGRLRTASASKGGLREAVREVVRRVMSQTARNRQIDLASLLACPACSGELQRGSAGFICRGCAGDYPDWQGVPMLNPRPD